MNTSSPPALPLPYGLLALLLAALPQEGERDPFAAPPALAAEIRPGSRTDGSAPILRGYAERADGEARALIELPGGETVLIRRGDLVRSGGPGRPAVLEVLEVGNGQVELAPVEGGAVLRLR